MKKEYHKITKISNLKDMLKKSGKMYGDRPAFKYKTDKENEFRIITHKEFREDVDALGTSLIELGLSGKRIAVISENRYEWDVAYLAICCGTGIVVPLDKLLPETEIESSIVRSGVEAIFYSAKYNEIMDNIRIKGTTKLKYFISMDTNSNTDKTFSEKELIDNGKKLIEAGNKKFVNAKINNEEMSIMLFTSGTTAISKIVALSHKNICTNLMDIASVIEINEEDILLSFLPLHHTFECTVRFPISNV